MTMKFLMAVVKIPTLRSIDSNTIESTDFAAINKLCLLPEGCTNAFPGDW